MSFHHPKFLAALLCLSAMPGAASAQTLLQPTEAAVAKSAAPKAAKAEPKLIYLPMDFLAHPGAVVPAPPKPETPEGNRDLAATKAMQAAADSARIARAAADDANESVWLYTEVLPGFEEAKLPATAKLFKTAQNDVDFEADRFKTFFARVRPFDIDHGIKTCVPSVYGGKARSYPSGHTTLGYGLGLVLAALIPEKADAILARAKVYGESRVVCGVHFPGDLAASEALGTAVALELLHNPEFKKAFAAAKIELVTAGLTK